MDLRPLASSGARGALTALCCAWLAACATPRAAPSSAEKAPPPAAAPSARCIQLLESSDVHGHIASVQRGTQHEGGLEAIAAVVQAFRQRFGEDVLYVDAGDLLQGTMASNFTGGKATIDAYNALRPGAVALGNHEFDYDGADPSRPILTARIHEARFPFLACNVRLRQGGGPPAALGIHPSTLLAVGALRVGVVGMATQLTPITTFPGNVEDLDFVPPGPCVIEEAKRLRAAGADTVVLLAHSGGRCPPGIVGCAPSGELFELLQSLPPGTVDAVAAGHTHQAFSLMASGVPVVEPAVGGERLGWLTLCAGEGAPRATLHPLIAPCLDTRTHALCTANADAPWLSVPGAMTEDEAFARAVAPSLHEVERQAVVPLGVTLPVALRRARDAQSPLGQLVARALQASAPGIDVGLINAGGLRADLEAGPLTFRSIYDVFPFESRVVTLTLTGAQLEALVNGIRQAGFGIPQLAGATVREEGKRLLVEVPGAPDRVLRMATLDFISRGGDGAPVLGPPTSALSSPVPGPRVRDVVLRFVQSHPEIVAELASRAPSR